VMPGGKGHLIGQDIAEEVEVGFRVTLHWSSSVEEEFDVFQ
jgi:hypothetical protein